MHRMKIGLIGAGLVLLLTGLFYAAVTQDFGVAVTQNAGTRVARAQRLYQHISRLAGIDLAGLAVERARRPGVVAVFDKTEETALRSAAFEECEAINAHLQKEGRKADIVAVLDSTGKIVARDLNPNADYGEVLRSRYPAVDQALKGRAEHDMWTWQNRVHVVAVAPISRPDGTIVGALVLAWAVSAKTAQENRDLLGAEIGYFHDGKVHASSFVSAADASKEDVAKTQALSNFVFAEGGLAPAALQRNTPTEVVRWTLEGTRYAVVAAPTPGNFADKTSGFVVLAAEGEGIGQIKTHGSRVVFLGLLATIIMLAAVMLTASRFIRPLDKIELGVAEVINGNIDYAFKPVGPDFEGLSNSLNVMLARLLGRPEPSEEAMEEEEAEAAGKRWKAESMVIAETDGAASEPEVAALGRESEAAYFPRIYNEYVDALRAQGQPSDGISVLSFMAKLSLAEAGLREKWECKTVRFQVQSGGGSVVFRPVKIA